jgi:hypothetical protein
VKLATFKIKGEERAGAVVGNAVIDLLNAHVAESRASKAAANKEAFASIRDLLDAGAKGLSAAKAAQAYAIKRLGDPIKADGKLTHESCSHWQAITHHTSWKVEGNWQRRIRKRPAFS